MNSPFPGMDPFLELHWGDVHSRLITYLSDALQPHLPDDLRARIEERVFVESDFGHSRLVIPGVRVFESTHRQGGLNSGGTAIAELTDVEATEVEPFVFNLHGLEITEGFIEIRERGGGRVVTVIEILSRANKFPGPGQEMYRQKQDEVLQSNASLVEIDLVRGGQRVLALPTCDIPPQHRHDSLACISPGWKRSQRVLYALPLTKQLPGIRIPLRETDPPVRLQLQPLIDRAYELGGYDDIDYTQELDPPLTTDEVAWVKTLWTTK